MTHLETEPLQSQETVAHLISLMQGFDTAMLITRQRSGALHGRPMSLVAIDDDATLWFMTSAASPKAEELSEDGRAMVSFQGSTQFANLNGNAELVFDRDKIKELWKESYRVWYESKADPDIVLVRFTPHDAEYWDSFGIKGLKHVFHAARAYLTGEPLKNSADPIQGSELHGKVRFWDPGAQADSTR
jgi:general stress protein 26